MCKYSEGSWKCPHENLLDSEYCIFHLKDDNKDIEEFNKGIYEILETDEKVINFTGFYFPYDTAKFLEKCFNKDVDFSSVVFTGYANFCGAKFYGSVSFKGAEFFDQAIFLNAEFSGKTSFVSTIFSKGANFISTKFSDVASFEKVKFLHGVIFMGAEFSSSTNFTMATFSKQVDFSSVKFFESVNFIESVFLETVNFIYTQFSGNVFFTMVKFSGNVIFVLAKFSNLAFFNKAVFCREVTFNEANFSGEASFYGVEFFGKTSFSWAKFCANTEFKGVEFSENVDFSSALLDGKSIFIPNNSKEINFENTFFSDNVRIMANLSKCCFNGSNIERVDLSDSTWDEHKNQGLITKMYNYFFNSSIIIWEESQGELSTNWKKLEGIYRRLKQSYQKSGDYETAGKFYFQEMECKRKQLGYFHSRFHNVVYRGFCGYGEKPFNVVLISIITIFAFAISYFYNGIEINGAYIIDYNLSLSSFDFSWINDFLWSLYTSIITFTTLGYGDVHPIGRSRVFASFESLIGIFMTALFIFVFTRKMLR